MPSPHSWRTVTLAFPEGIASFAVCDRCYARTQHPAHFTQYGPPCLPEPSDRETVERFLASLDVGGPRHA